MDVASNAAFTTSGALVDTVDSQSSSLKSKLAFPWLTLVPLLEQRKLLSFSEMARSL
jgi:hypothetical protein